MNGTNGVWCPQNRINLVAAGYELGEAVEEVQNHPALPELMRLHKMQDDPSLWGWGTYRRTERTQAQLAIAAAKRTMAGANVEPNEIDSVVLCSVSFNPGVSASLAFVNEVMGALSLEKIPYLGLTLGRCATAMSGLSVAATMIAAGRYDTVLVIASDKLQDEQKRLEPFGVFSDAASACILGSGEKGTSLACAHQISSYSQGTDMSSSLTGASRQALGTAVPELMREVRHVFHDNLFLPIISMREQLAGFKGDQLALHNTSRVGHGFGADPVINLVDAANAGRLIDQEVFALIAGTPGLRHTLIWRYSSHLALMASQ